MLVSGGCFKKADMPSRLTTFLVMSVLGFLALPPTDPSVLGSSSLVLASAGISVFIGFLGEWVTTNCYLVTFLQKQEIGESYLFFFLAFQKLLFSTLSLATLSILFLFKKLCVHVCMWHLCSGTHLEVRGQLLCGFLGSDSGCQAFCSTCP